MHASVLQVTVTKSRDHCRQVVLFCSVSPFIPPSSHTKKGGALGKIVRVKGACVLLSQQRLGSGKLNVSHNYNIVCTASFSKKPSYRLMFLKPFNNDFLVFSKGIYSFSPARSHSSVSVALDRASSNSGSRVVTSSLRVSIGFCLGTNALPIWRKRERAI